MNLAIREAIFLAALPYRRRVFQRGGWRLSRGPGSPDWTSFLSDSFAPDVIAAARREADARAAELAGADFGFVSFWEDSYPPLLREIFDPPAVLFYSGAAPVFSRDAEGIVGSRRAHPVARQAVHLYVESLPPSTAIVSGFARGIDREAHLAGVQKNRPGIAVLGAGVLCPGPASNADIPRLAKKRGASFSFVSEFIPSLPGVAYNFPRRNRIIAGITRRTNVFQAPGKSGALITAEYALEEGRDLAVFDHPLFSSDDWNNGGRALLADGAERIVLPELDKRILPRPSTPAERSRFFEKQSQGLLWPLGSGQFLDTSSEGAGEK